MHPCDRWGGCRSPYPSPHPVALGPREVALPKRVGDGEVEKDNNSFPVLETPRLRLRRFEPRDDSDLHALLGDPAAMRHWNFAASSSRAATAKTRVMLAKSSSPYAQLAWSVVTPADDRCIGLVTYHHREARNRKLEIGYAIVPQQQRQGFAREAVSALLGYCFDRLAAHRIEAYIDPENRASIGLAEDLGFRCEGGPLADFWCVDGRYLSVMVYALLAKPG
jgi:[ribosomal protein S5]-alanine N-acetyltransferase